MFQLRRIAERGSRRGPIREECGLSARSSRCSYRGGKGLAEAVEAELHPRAVVTPQYCRGVSCNVQFFPVAATALTRDGVGTKASSQSSIILLNILQQPDYITHMRARPSKRLQVIALVLMTAATVSFHYGFLLPRSIGHGSLLHAIHGRLCYIPIILAAIWFGVRGGLTVAFAITVATLPYPRYRGITDHHTLIGEYTEMVFYVAIGLMTGLLIERQWREQARSESLQRELARRERLSSLGQMAAGLAHEIKNPLGSIQGAAEILSDDAPARDASRTRELLDILHKESKRLGTVVDDFLGFARPRPLSLAPLDLGDVAERAAAQVAIDASARRIAIERHPAPDLPLVLADAERMHQVFLNLLLNALAASPDRGRVVVSSARRERGGEPCVAVSIRDFGDGIAPDVLPRVFDPFFTTREHGTGLGLSISHTIVQEHGGWIDVDSPPGAGTEVVVIVPVDRDRRGR